MHPPTVGAKNPSARPHPQRTTNHNLVLLISGSKPPHAANGELRMGGAPPLTRARPRLQRGCWPRTEHGATWLAGGRACKCVRQSLRVENSTSQLLQRLNRLLLSCPVIYRAPGFVQHIKPSAAARHLASHLIVLNCCPRHPHQQPARASPSTLPSLPFTYFPTTCSSHSIR